jgi:hypothetical protein
VCQPCRFVFPARFAACQVILLRSKRHTSSAPEICKTSVDELRKPVSTCQKRSSFYVVTTKDGHASIGPIFCKRPFER